MTSAQTASRQYPTLYSPLQLGALTVPNRFVVPAITTNFAAEGGYADDRLIEYLKARARGGYGLIFTENLGVHPSGRVMPRMAMASDDSYLPGLTRLAREVKAYGAVLFGQINHAGRQTQSRMTGLPLVAPSAVACPINREVPEALTIDAIHEMEKAYIDAAERLFKAGFDGVEIHGAHGYLVAGFLSRYSNKRTDEYGGSLENRMRFILNIVNGIQARVGRQFPVSVRISALEFVPDGLDLPESIEITKRLRETGIQLISISVGVYESFNRLSMVTGETEGRWLDLAGEIRRECQPLPVIGVGRIKRAEVAERALNAGQIDLAAFGRASIADPDLPKKVLHGEISAVDSCLGCNVCLGRSARPETICPINPIVGREHRTSWLPAAKNQMNLRIFGSSVAAMTAAWLMGKLGHRVLVDTAGEPLGGMQMWRAAIPGQQEYLETIAVAKRRLLSVGGEFTSDPIEEGSVLWGESRFLPVDRKLVAADVLYKPVWQVFASAEAEPTAATIAVVGSSLMTVESAILLASRKHTVHLFTGGGSIAADAHPGYREKCRDLLIQLNIVLHTEPAPLATDVLSGFGEVFLGAGAHHDTTDIGAWTQPQGAYRSVIRDAYEPGLMTQGIYEAMDLAMSTR